MTPALRHNPARDAALSDAASSIEDAASALETLVGYIRHSDMHLADAGIGPHGEDLILRYGLKNLDGELTNLRKFIERGCV